MTNGNGNDGTAVADANLPDPSSVSKVLAAIFLVLAVVLALLADATNLDKDPPFDPNAIRDADLAIFAGFFAAAAIIERVIELLGPYIPWWSFPGKQYLAPNVSPAPTAVQLNAAIAQKKADRGYSILTLAALMGVIASIATGLYLANAIGMSLSRWADIIVTGVAVSGGTKGLHELIKSLQKAKGSGTTAG